jgi:hypothetical protein
MRNTARISPLLTLCYALCACSAAGQSLQRSSTESTAKPPAASSAPAASQQAGAGSGATPDTTARSSLPGASLPPAQSPGQSGERQATANFDANLALACVVLGGQQRLTVQSQPSYTVAFNSKYSDGKQGDAYGGYGVHPTDAEGRLSVAWTVATTAPMGPVAVGVGTANGSTPTTELLSFRVQLRC